MALSLYSLMGSPPDKAMEEGYLGMHVFAPVSSINSLALCFPYGNTQ